MLARLRRRLTALAAALTGCVVVAVAAVSFCLCGALYTAQRQASFEAEVSELAGQWELDGTLDLTRARPSGVQLYLTENGTPLVLSGLAEDSNCTALWRVLIDTGFDPDVPPLFSQSEEITLERAALPDGAARVAARKQVAGHSWRLLVAWQPLDAERQVLLRAAAVFALVAAAGVAALTAVCWAVAGRAIRPVQEAMREQREFVRAAGHELRTPLGVLRAGLAVLPGEDDETVRRHIGLLDAEAARMGGLIDDLLTLSGGGLVQPEPPKPLAPDTLLLELAEAWEPAVRRAGRRLRVFLPDGPVPVIDGHREALRQILSVFLDNALRYAPGDTEIELHCSAQGKKILWEVRDHGPGVPDAEKSAVFRRFWRADSVRADRKHFGLGLSVAAELAERCGLRLSVRDTPGGGATFRVEAEL